MTRILVKRDILQKKVGCVNEEVDIYVVYNNDIDKHVSKMEHFIDEFISLMEKSKLSQVDEHHGKVIEG